MEAASNSLAGATIAKLAADYIQLRQDVKGASTADPHGPHNQLLTQLDQAFKPWLDQTFSDSTSDQQAASNATDAPTPYSTDDIPSEVQDQPMSQFQPDDVGRMQSFASNSAVMSAAYRTSSDDVGVRNQPADNRIVRDHMPIPYPGNTGNGDVIVRDHRHPPTSLPPAAPPAAPPLSGNTGTNFTSGADLDNVDQLNSNLEAAKENALANPNDPKAQIAFQDAAQALQLLVNMLLQMSQMLASMADKAISNSKVNAA
jgi:hypothetical protein